MYAPARRVDDQFLGLPVERGLEKRTVMIIGVCRFVFGVLYLLESNVAVEVE